MRRLITVLIAAAMTMTLLILKANAQGKAKGHHKHEWKNDRHSSNDQYNYHRGHHAHGHERQHYAAHHFKSVHQHSRHCDHKIVVGYDERPRYVFYREYDMYFDHHRNAYITYSGRGWIITTKLPNHLLHINLNSAVCHSVNYYDDDLVAYLRFERPTHGAVIRTRY